MTETVSLQGIPTFRINSYAEAVAFYVDFLGFTLDWEHRFGENEPVYMQVSKNGLRLHLSENERFKPVTIVFVETKGIEQLHAELAAKNNHPVPEIVNTGWGTRQMEISDPAGNLLRFNETL